MEIMSFKKRSGNVYEIELNTGEKHKIYDDLILKYELLLDRKIDKEKLDKVLKENAIYDSYYRALKYINIRMRSKVEIENYLKRLNFNKDEIDTAIERLKSEGYLDSKVYAKAYVNDAITLSFNGPKKIKNDLIKLGIEEVYIDSELEAVAEDTWFERILRFITKKARTNKSSEKIFKNKVTSSLITLGYPIEMIGEVVDGFKIDTSESFIEEASKMYNRLSRKYQNKELELQFKSKMYAKGYESDMINSFLEKTK